MKVSQILESIRRIVFDKNNKSEDLIQTSNTHHTEVTFTTTKDNMRKFRLFSISNGMTSMKLFMKNKIACYRIDYNGAQKKNEINQFIRNLDDKTLAIYY